MDTITTPKPGTVIVTYAKNVELPPGTPDNTETVEFASEFQFELFVLGEILKQMAGRPSPYLQAEDAGRVQQIVIRR